MERNTATDQQAEEVAEQSDKDQADETGSGVEDADAEGTEEEEGASVEEGADDGDDDESDAIISQKRFDELKNDPEALRKELQGAATKKFQSLSAQRKALEPYADFIQALEDDPTSAVTTLAEQFGIELVKPKGTTAAEVVVDISDQIKKALTESLGEEYGDLAVKLAPGIEKVARLVAGEMVKPYAQGQDTLIKDSAAREAKTAVEAFAKTHPDYTKHERAMVALSKRLAPGKDMTEAEYLEILYDRVTRTSGTARRLVDKINKGAAKGKEGRTHTNSSESVISKKPTGIPTWDEAVAAAKQGIRFED